LNARKIVDIAQSVNTAGTKTSSRSQDSPGQKISFRAAKVGDQEKVFSIHVCSVNSLCRSAYAPEIIERWFEDRLADYYIPALEAGHILFAILNEREIGFVEARSGEIVDLFVLPEVAGRGIGKALLERGLTMALGAGAHRVCIEATINSIEFYRRAGFEEISKGQWTSPTGAVCIPVIFMEYSPPGSASL
jgi:GNAT superfamily N-acetyltransferase